MLLAFRVLMIITITAATDEKYNKNSPLIEEVNTAWENIFETLLNKVNSTSSRKTMSSHEYPEFESDAAFLLK